MKAKRLIASIVCAAAMVTSLAACGGDKQVASGDVDTIVIWSGDTHSKDVVTEYINNWNENEGKEKGIYIDYQVKDGGTINDALELALDSGTDIPDMFGGANKKNVENGHIVAIDDLPGGPELVEEWNEKGINSYWGQHEDENGVRKTYAYPSAMTTLGIVYNKEMFKAAGIVDENGEAKPPKTFDEMREYAKKLTNPDKREYGIVLPMKWSGWFNSDILHPAFATHGYYNFNPEKNEFDFSYAKEAAEMYLGMKEDGSIYPGAEAIDNDPARALFAEGQIGMKIAFSFDVGVLNDQFASTIDWGVAPLPTAQETPEYKQLGSVGWGFSVGSAAVERVGGEKMMEVVKMFCSEDYRQYMFDNGVAIPADTEGISTDSLKNAKRGWKEFFEMALISHPEDVISPSTDLAGKKSYGALFMEEVWSGKMSVDEWIAECNKTYAEGCELYKKNNPYPDDKFLVKDWFERVKR